MSVRSCWWRMGMLRRRSVAGILALPKVALVAVNQCSGNSLGYFELRIPGGQ
jgi:hypothetical protein